MTETAKKEPGEDQQPSFWSSCTRADMRLLVVTIAANIVTVVVVGIALIIAGSTSRPTPVVFFDYLSTLLVCAVAIFVIRRAGKTMRRALTSVIRVSWR